MRKRRAAQVVLVAAALALAGCATHMAAEPPAGVSLAGSWKLDLAASDDPQKLLDKMRAEPTGPTGPRIPRRIRRRRRLHPTGAVPTRCDARRWRTSSRPPWTAATS